jgi:hypothetical protein
MSEIHLTGYWGEDLDPLRPTAEEWRAVMEATADWDTHTDEVPPDGGRDEAEYETPW